MRLGTLLVSALLGLATVAALIALLESRDDALTAFTYKVDILCLTMVFCTDRIATGGARDLPPR
jgi:hypothetical protein